MEHSSVLRTGNHIIRSCAILQLFPQFHVDYVKFQRYLFFLPSVMNHNQDLSVNHPGDTCFHIA